MKGNREYKSDVFSLLMKNPQNALDLYNAVNHSDYTNPDMVKIPTPRFAVFYNGEKEQPEQYDLKLSDAYIQPVNNPELELTCKVFNINYGKNRELLARCGFLKGYMTFVDYVRKYHREYGYNELEHAIEVSIDRCIYCHQLKRSVS